MKRRIALRLSGASLAAALTMAAPAAAAPEQVNTKRLRDAVTVNGILAHERAFQAIANRNGATRASGTPGYDASAAYVRGRLQRAGYRVFEQRFDFEFYQETAPSTLARSAPSARAYVNGTDFATLAYSGSGQVTGIVVPVDVTVPPTPEPSSTSGCETADFAGFPAGAVALVQRGTCTFAVKVANAAAAGASAVLVFNEGQPDRTDAFPGTLGEAASVPALSTSFAAGEELVALARAGTPATVSLSASVIVEQRPTVNVIADTPTGDGDETVVVGAHLDSVPEGPGINDNGSGSATILETAEEMAELGVRPRRKVRFAFWGAEEAGLLGSTHYVNSLSSEQIAQTYANLNFDMLGSPNYVRFVYDGDGSDTPLSGPPGSGVIEDLFTRFYASQGLETEPTEFDGRSDYGPFIEAGIPAGGLFSGAEGIKTPEQAATYGGTAGVAYDPNYHLAGDTVGNLNTRALAEHSDGVAHVTLTLARSRQGLFDDGSRRGARRSARVLAQRGHAVQR